MTGTKVIAVSAVVGCIMSFLCGIIAGVSFAVVLLRAVLFAVIGGIIGFGISFVWNRFLLYQAETVSEPLPGDKLDITIGDEVLPEDENGPAFYVDENVAVSAPDVPDHTEQPAAAAGAVADSPAADTKLPSEKSVAQSAQPAASGTLSAEPQPVQPLSDDNELDSLPDISDLVSGADMMSVQSGMVDTQERHVSVTSVSDSKDVGLMAQAIRTVLSKDS